jgi:hypothetical protein
MRARPTSQNDAAVPSTAPAPYRAVRYAAPDPPRPRTPIARVTASTSNAPTVTNVAASTSITSVAGPPLRIARVASFSSPTASGRGLSALDRAGGGASSRKGSTITADPIRQSAPPAYTAPGVATARISPAKAGAATSPTLKIQPVIALSAMSCSVERAIAGDMTA